MPYFNTRKWLRRAEAIARTKLSDPDEATRVQAFQCALMAREAWQRFDENKEQAFCSLFALVSNLLYGREAGRTLFLLSWTLYGMDAKEEEMPWITSFLETGRTGVAHPSIPPLLYL